MIAQDVGPVAAPGGFAGTRGFARPRGVVVSSYQRDTSDAARGSFLRALGRL